MRTIATAAFAAAMMLPALACAQRDVVTFGGDAVVREGEVVNDIVTMGGDARVDGTVLGDVVTMGGDVSLGANGDVRGDLVTMGGKVAQADGAETGGEVVVFDGSHPPVAFRPDFGRNHERGLGAFVADTLDSLVSYGLLFVLGLLLMGVARERLDGLQLAIVRQPFKALGYGVLALFAAAVTIVILVVTIIGIPAAVVLAVGLPFALYIGLAAAATVIGAAIPASTLAGKPVLQLLAGCGALFVAGLVPFVGDILVAVAAAVGLGALVLTRFRKAAAVAPETLGAGPYRTSAT